MAMHLTARELQIVELIAAGKDNKTIAATLGIAMSTVKAHLWHMARRLNVQGPDSRVSIVMFALRNGLID